MKKLKLNVDTSEGYPIRFPSFFRSGGDLYKVEVVHKKLVTGDYERDGHTEVGIERKGRPTEVYACVAGERKAAFISQLERMRAKYDKPILLLDTGPFEIISHDYSTYVKNATAETGEAVLLELTRLVMAHDLQLICLNRVADPVKESALGRFVCGLLLGRTS